MDNPMLDLTVIRHHYQKIGQYLNIPAPFIKTAILCVCLSSLRKWHLL